MTRERRIGVLGGLALAVALACPAFALSVDTKDRDDVVRFYRSAYLASEGVDADWTGDVSDCEAGRLDADYLDAGLLRLHYFRVMAGLPDGLKLDASLSAKCQQAALMMTANRKLSHRPSTRWICHTRAGAEAASKSNLALGYASLPAAITGWIMDKGTPSLGHRRWILSPPLESTGFGAVPDGEHAGYAMWVSGGRGERSASPEWIAWPPPGFVPYQVVPTVYWSFSYPRADFSATKVSMTRNGVPVDVSVQPLAANYADNTIAWRPSGLSGDAPTKDVRYRVTLKNVRVGGAARTFNYECIVIDPE